MRKILGYKLKNVPVEKIDMPVGANIIIAMDVNGEPTVFADIDPNELVLETRTIYRVTTGRPVLDQVLRKGYIGSFTVANYGIVYHFFTGGDPQELEVKPVGIIEEVNVLPSEAEKAGPPEHPFQR